jgi:RHS repeat-associated protein
MEKHTKNKKTIFNRKTAHVFLIVLCLFLLFPQPGDGHMTPGDNFDGYGKRYGLNSDPRDQGDEDNDCGGGGRKNKGGDPVDTATGEFTETVTDLSILGRIPIEVRRTYRSQRQHYSSGFGANWFFIYDYKLRKLKDGDLAIIYPSGDERAFEAKGGGRYELCCGDTTVIIENANGTYTLKPRGFRTYIFNGAGNLIRLQESSGDALYFTYEVKKKPVYGPFRYSAGTRARGVVALRKRLKKIRDDYGRYVKFSYYDDTKKGGRVKTAAFMPGTQHAVIVSYDYDNAGNLISVTGPATSQHPNGTVTRYTYSKGNAAPILDHNLISITAPREVAAGKGPYLVNKYDDKDRVVEQKYGRGTLVFTYGMDGENRVTTIKSRAGETRVTTFDQRGNVIKDVIKGRKLRPEDPDEYVFTYEYDENTGRLIKVTNPSGNVRVHGYDEQGNFAETRRKEKDGPDSQNDTVSLFTYENRYQRLKTYTDPLGRQTIYDYDYEEAERGDLNGDGITNQKFGQLIRVTYPPAKPGEKPAVYLYRYNSHAQFTSGTDPLGRINRVIYYAEGLSGGRVKKYINDANGAAATTTLEYDAIGNVTASTDANGNTTRFKVAATGHITRSITTKPFEYKVDYFYDENGNLTRVDIENKGPDGKIDAKNPAITFISEYDLLDNIVAEKTEIGKVGAAKVKAAQATGKDVLVTRMTYDVDDRLKKLVHPSGETEKYQYDERGLILRRTLAPGTAEKAVTDYTYSLDGYLSRVKDPNGNITRFKMDGFNRVKEVVDPLGNRLTRAYDRVGNLVKREIYGPDGKLLSRREWEYDGRDRLVMEHAHFFGPDGQPLQDGPLTPGDGRASHAYEYDRLGNLLKITDDNKNSFLYTYDGLNRQVKVIDPVGNKVTYTYDKNGNILARQESDKHPGGKPDVLTTYRYVYDELNRLKKTVDPLGNITRFSYDSRSNPVYRKNANGDGMGLVYDSLSRLLRVKQEMRDPNGTLVKTLKESYRYYGREHLASITDHNGNTASFSYNALGLLTKTRYADGSQLTLTRDALGNILERVDPRGIKTTYTYTKDNLVRTSTTGTRVKTFTYDGLDRMLSAEVRENGNRTGLLSWQYDSMSNAVSAIQDGKGISRRFDGEGNLLALTYPDNISVTRTFDPLQRIKRIERGSEKVTGYTYIGPDRVFRQEFGNNTYLSRKYDGAQRIIKNISGLNNAVFDGAKYQYDAVGQRIEGKSLPGQGKIDRFQYDSAGRLEKARYDIDINTQAVSRSFTFQLDGAGNLMSRTINGKKTLFNHDAGGQYQSDPLNRYTDIQGQKRQHDASGNLAFDGRYRYLYDHENRLIEVREAGSKNTVATYGYDALGRRISKQKANDTKTYLYDGYRVIAEYKEDGSLAARYIYGSGIDEILQMERGGQTYTYHRDIQGNITSLTDASGKIVETYSYDPFGAVTIRDGSGNRLSRSKAGNPYYFTGRRLDPETGLYYYRLRMYDPGTGRFLQHDPLGFHEGPNLYQYAAGDPFNLTDPMGLGWGSWLWEETKLLGGTLYYLPGAVADSFVDGSAHDSLQGYAYSMGGKYLGMSDTPTYGHTKEFNMGKKIGDVILEIEKAIVISAATGGLGNVLKGAKIFQVCSKGGRIATYVAFKAIDAGADTLTEYIMDENGNCWTAEEFLKRFGKNALYSVLGDAAAATLAKIRGSEKGFFENMGDFAMGKAPCFTAGTLVATENGPKPIEKIEVGDKVWAMDPGKGEARLAEVSAAYERKTNRLYIIELEGETIETTREHPFWVKGKGWVEAGNLVEGDKITTREKARIDIRKITVKPGDYKVYNLKVKDIHTYFVSVLKVLVHNNNKCPYDNMSKGELEKSKKSYEDLIAEHKQKLADYKANPFKYDNKNLLSGKSKAIQDKIIEGRIKALEKQIKKQEGELKKILDRI